MPASFERGRLVFFGQKLLKPNIARKKKKIEESGKIEAFRFPDMTSMQLSAGWCG